MAKKTMSRRSFLKSGAVAAGALMASGPTVLLPRKGQAAADKGPIVFCTYGGAYGDNMQNYVVDPFVKKTGIQVIRTSTPAFARVKAMVDTGNIEWDVVDAEGRLYYRSVKLNLLTPLDWTVIGHKDELIPGGAEPYGAANEISGPGLAWSKKKFTQETAPKSWVDFFSLPGKRTTQGEAYRTLEIALLGDGVPAHQLYPLDVDRALKKLSSVKKNIIFWANTKMSIDLLVSNEVDFGCIGAGPVHAAMEAGEPIGFTWNQILGIGDRLIIPKGSKHVEAAMKFISHCMEPEIQAAFSNHYLIGPTNLKAFNFISEQRQTVLPTSPKINPLRIVVDDAYWAEHEQEIAKRFEKWMTQ
jgi:putative spermidine/putrescine transport system substrate-binding protein